MARNLANTDISDPAAPTCGKCGYCIHGVTELVCPECGSDLRVVGIIPAAEHRIVKSFAWRVTLWSFFIAIFGTGISIPAMYWFLPYCTTGKVTVNYKLTAFQPPVSLMIWGSDRSAQPGISRPAIRPDLIVLIELSKVAPSFMDLKPETGAFDYYSPNSGQIAGIHPTTEDFRKAFKLPAPLNQSQIDVLNALPGIAKLLRNNPANLPNTITDSSGNIVATKLGGNGGFYVHDEPNPTVIVLLSIFWLGLWFVGFRKLRKNRWKRPGVSDPSIGSAGIENG